VTLTVAVDRPNALLAVRLCDVAPTGASTLVSRGLLNLTHRESDEHPTPLEPGQPYTVTICLNASGYALPAGHRWRVAISPTYWPHAWPSPEPVTLNLFAGSGCHLHLPVRPPQPEDANLFPFDEAEGSAPLALEFQRVPSRQRTVERDVVKSLFKLVDHNDGGSYRFVASGLDHETVNTDTYTIIEGDPLSASTRCEWTIAIGRGDWRTRVETNSFLTADAATFRVTNMLDAYEGDTRVFSKTWTFTVPRDLV
jgi:hypothetical protein